MRATLYAGGVGGAGGDELCALCMLKVVEGGLCSSEAYEVPEVMQCVQLYMPKMMSFMLSYAGGREGGLCLPEASEVMRCVQLCMLEVLEVLDMQCAACNSVCWRCWEVPEVMRFVLSVFSRSWGVGSVRRRRTRCRR